MTTQLCNSSDALVNLELLGKLEEIMVHYSSVADFALDMEDSDKLGGAYGRLIGKRADAELCRGEAAIMAAVRAFISINSDDRKQALR
eukprot:7680535-Pyramimonas_sp.AAC.1